jgi:hypothetical protein
MCSHTFTDLVGRSIRGSVGEPWDFESRAGANFLTGEVEAVSPPTAESDWLLCRVRPFQYRSHVISQVVAIARNPGIQPLADLNDGKRVVVNMFFDAEGKLLVGLRVLEILATKAAPFLVGSIEVLVAIEPMAQEMTLSDFRVTILGRSGLRYRHGTKTVFIDGEMLTGAFDFVVYTNSIARWDDARVISEGERKTIVANIGAVFRANGLTADFETR